MKTIPVFTLLLLIFTSHLYSQDESMELYPPDAIPNYRAVGEDEKWDTTDIVRVSKVQVPDIKVYLPVRENRTGKAVLICPGGGYHILAYDKEGEDIAKFWNSKGVTAFVLKYRLPTSEAQIIPHKSPLMDAQRALRLLRYNSEKWGINKREIGVMGFSAGGHLASSLSTHFDLGDPGSDDPVERESCRPDFSILVYPVITFTGDYQHAGSRMALVGDDAELMKYFSSELQVSQSTPPSILIHASDDKVVPVENSIVYYQALINNNVPAEMHIFPEGGHGFGLASKRKNLSGWADLVYEWLFSSGI